MEWKSHGKISPWGSAIPRSSLPVDCLWGHFSDFNLYSPWKLSRSTQNGRSAQTAEHGPSLPSVLSIPPPFSFILCSSHSLLPPFPFTISWTQGKTYSPPSNLSYNKQPACSLLWHLEVERKIRRVLYFFLVYFLFFFLNIASCFSPSLIPFKINISSAFICSHWKKFHFILARIFRWMS